MAPPSPPPPPPPNDRASPQPPPSPSPDGEEEEGEEEGNAENIGFVQPATLGLFGVSQSGKSTFLTSLIRRRHSGVFSRPVGHTYVFFNVWTAEYETLHADLPTRDITFIRGKLTTDFLREELEMPPVGGRAQVPLFVLDDLGGQADADLTELITVYTHHYDIFLAMCHHCLTSQQRGGAAHEFRTQVSNMQYSCLFRQRDLTAIGRLGTQIQGPGRSQLFVNIYKDALRKPYAYLLVDHRPTCPDKFQLRTDVLRPFHPDPAQAGPCIVYERIDGQDDDDDA